jgi:hypothetical protein
LALATIASLGSAMPISALFRTIDVLLAALVLVAFS